MRGRKGTAFTGQADLGSNPGTEHCVPRAKSSETQNFHFLRGSCGYHIKCQARGHVHYMHCWLLEVSFLGGSRGVVSDGGVLIWPSFWHLDCLGNKSVLNASSSPSHELVFPGVLRFCISRRARVWAAVLGTSACPELTYYFRLKVKPLHTQRPLQEGVDRAGC